MRQASLWPRMVVLVAGLLLYGGLVWEPPWSTVDEGVGLMRGTGMARGELPLSYPLTYEAAEGRFRPADVYFWFLQYLCFGLDCWKWHALRLLLLLVTSQLLFSIARTVSGSPWAGLISSLLFLCFSPMVEVWYRLGDPGFYSTAFTAASVWLVVKSFAKPSGATVARWGLLAGSAVLLAPAYFAKETSVALTGLAAALLVGCWIGAGPLLQKRNVGLSLGYLAAHALLVVALLVAKELVGTKALSEGNYSRFYQASPGLMAATAFKYADVLWNGMQLLFPFALLFWGRRVQLWLRNRHQIDACDGWTWVGLGWFASVLAIMLPWRSPLGRYLAVGLPGLCLAAGLCVWCFLDESRRLPLSWWRRLLCWLVGANLALLPFIAAARNYNYFFFRHDYDHAAFRVMQTIAREAKPGTRLYMNFPADYRSIFQEMMLLLPVLFNRTDLEHLHYNLPDRPEPRPGDWLLLFVREPPGRTTEVALPAAFHTACLERLGDRLRLVTQVRFDRLLWNCYPDAPFFNAVARAGIQLPDYLGMNAGQRRSLIQREPSLIEWRIYEFVR